MLLLNERSKSIQLMSFIVTAFLYSQFWAPTLNEVHTAATQCAAQFCSRQEMFTTTSVHYIEF